MLKNSFQARFRTFGVPGVRLEVGALIEIAKKFSLLYAYNVFRRIHEKINYFVILLFIEFNFFFLFLQDVYFRCNIIIIF